MRKNDMSIPRHEDGTIKINLQLFADDLPDDSEDAGNDNDVDNSDDSDDSDGFEDEDSDEGNGSDSDGIPADEEEYDEIDYNKEKVKIPKSERKAYLQKGMNYDKVHGKLNETESFIKEIETLTGMSRAQVVEYLREQQKQTEIQQYEEQGYSPEEAQKEYERDKKINAIESELFQTKRQAQIQEEKKALVDEPYFTELEKDVDDLLKREPTLDVKTAYIFLRGEKMPELLKEKSTEAAKKAVENHKRQAKRGTESFEGAPAEGEKGLDFTPDEKKWAEGRVKQGLYKSMKEAYKFLRG